MAENGNNPDTNICLIEKIENITGRAMGLLFELQPKSRCQKKQIKKALDSLDKWQTTRLFALRKAFE